MRVFPFNRKEMCTLFIRTTQIAIFKKIIIELRFFYIMPCHIIWLMKIQLPLSLNTMCVSVHLSFRYSKTL